MLSDHYKNTLLNADASGNEVFPKMKKFLKNHENFSKNMVVGSNILSISP